MLRSSELKEHSDIHTWQDMVFIEACNRKDIALLNYFIFDYKIDTTEKITKFLKEKDLTQIAKIFNLGENAKPLTKESLKKRKM